MYLGGDDGDVLNIDLSHGYKNVIGQNSLNLIF